jgi:Mycothiol-dependent nitroreductase Rv2466c
LGPAERGSREFTEPLLEQAGLPARLAAVLDDPGWDGELRAETDEALALTGKDVGTPVIHFGPPGGTAFFGPVISRLPSDQDAVRLWDHVVGLASFPGFAELKRSQHARQHGGAERGRRDHVDLERQPQVLRLDAGGGAERLDGSRVVDQDVDPAHREHGRNGATALLLISQISGHHLDPLCGHIPVQQQARVSSSCPAVRASRTRRASAPPSPSAMARPMPRPAPVISAVLPARSAATAVSLSVTSGAARDSAAAVPLNALELNCPNS